MSKRVPFVDGVEIEAVHLGTTEVLHFAARTAPEWAVRYGYATEKHLCSRLFELQDRRANGDIEAVTLMESEFPVVEGEKTVACGDWCAKKGV